MDKEKFRFDYIVKFIMSGRFAKAIHVRFASFILVLHITINVMFQKLC